MGALKLNNDFLRPMSKDLGINKEKRLNVYRFGFNGQEKDDEVFGSTGTSYTVEFWQYDSRIDRRWNLDPKPNPSISYYATFAGNPILYSDPLGDWIPTKITRKARKNGAVKKIQNLFAKEYGINLEYKKGNLFRRGRLYATGTTKTNLSISKKAQSDWLKVLDKRTIAKSEKGRIVKLKIGFNEFTKPAETYNEITSPERTTNLTKIDLGYFGDDNNFKPTVLDYGGMPDFAKRTFNLARAFEHDYLGHGIMELDDDKAKTRTTPLDIVNVYREQMGLGDYKRLQYNVNNKPGTTLINNPKGKPFVISLIK